MTKFARRDYTLELVTPAFLGGADQSAEWRTPGIKALIRQWWRVAYVAEHGVNVDRMRRAEGELFGTVNDNSKSARRAMVSIRFTDLPKGGKPEYVECKIHPRDQSQALPYLAYGPFERPTTPSEREALTAKSSARLALIVQGASAEEANAVAINMDITIGLLNQFGALGSRSRNGWGSLKISGMEGKPDLSRFARPLEQCLQTDWATSIAKDLAGLMIWNTPVKPDWKMVMEDLKTARKEHQNRYAKSRHIRSTINGPSPGNQARWPNQFIFKVLPVTGGFIGQIALLAHHWPSAPTKNLADLLQGIADNLDAQNRIFTRMKT